MTQLPSAPKTTVSTIPANGDLNPYGVAFVPRGFPGGGALQPGDVLVSNFNNSSNSQGTGTTIVKVSPDGKQSLFFQGSDLGLTTALGVLKGGFVLVGNTPMTTVGGTPTVQQGSLLILDRNGKLVETLANQKLLDGPWDLTIANDFGPFAQGFVSNVLSGTVTRINLFVPFNGSPPVVLGMTQIASGYAHRTDPAALVVGPTGLAFDAKSDTLYVASTADNAIYAVPNAATTRTDQGTGRVIFQDAHLRGPLGLVQTPNGDLITTNGDAVNPDPNQPSELVEFTPTGKFVGQFSIDPAQGAAFGIALGHSDHHLKLAAVNDDTNMLELFTVHR